MRLGQAQEIFAKNAALLILHAYEVGYQVRLGEAWRPQVMAFIYSGLYGLIEKATGKIQWFAKRGKKKSLHLIKLAIDLNLFRDGAYLDKTEDHRELGKYWESLHPLNRWGGRYNDGNHYEMVI